LNCRIQEKFEIPLLFNPWWNSPRYLQCRSFGFEFWNLGFKYKLKQLMIKRSCPL